MVKAYKDNTMMFQLNNLKPAGKKRKTIGRGGSRGGTSGKGHKGQNARSGGKTHRGFEGGQMPLHRRLPKRGFTNGMFKSDISIVNVGQLNERFNNGDVVSFDLLVQTGLVRPKRSETQITKSRVLVKLLAHGTIDKKLIIRVNACSKSAKDAIEKAGGTVEVIKES